MDFLFSIFEFLVIAGGPFCVFAGMGKDKNVGKLTFRNLIAADSSIEITENTGCVTLKSNSSGVSVPLNKVPWGTTSSITWGFLEVDTDVQAITGAYIIANRPASIIGTTFSPGGNNLIVNPLNNKIFGSFDSVLVTSKESKMYQASRRNALIGGYENIICGGDNSSVINSGISCNQYVYISSILSSVNSQLCQTSYSSVLSSRKSNIRYISSGTKVCNSTIISSYLGRNTGNNHSTIISSRNSYIMHGNALSSVASSNSIISSCSSCICGGQVFDGITVGSLRSTVLSSICSNITDSCGSTIIGGNRNTVCVYTYAGGNVTAPTSCHNTIIGGTYNRISQNNSNESTGNIKYNSTLSSKCTFIYNSCVSSILTSESSAINGTYINAGRWSVIIGGVSGKKNSIIGSNVSAIINSPCSRIGGNCTIGIIGGCSNYISASYYSGIIGGFDNAIKTGTFRSSIIAGCLNCLYSSTGDSVIVAGDCNKILQSYRSSILGGLCNCIRKSINSAVLGGECNYAKSIASIDKSGVIISGCKNETYSKYSVIVGGKVNYIGNGGTTLYSAILGGESNSLLTPYSVIVGSCNITSSGSKGTTFLTNLIFDKHVCINSAHCGRSGTIAPGIAGFKIRNGFITTT